MDESQLDCRRSCASRDARSPARILGALILIAAAGCSAPVPVNRRAMLFKQFSDRVRQYVDLHRRLEAGLPQLKRDSSAAEIHDHERALAEAIRSANAGARHEDIFFDGMAAEIRSVLRKECNGPQGKELRAAIRDNNPSPPGVHGRVRLAVNAPYPAGVPLSTVPPGLLLNLPELPPEVEFRFVGRNLILRDVTANLIVDYIRDALPRP